VFITNGPCCATGSPIGRACSTRHCAPVGPAVSVVTSAGSSRAPVRAASADAIVADGQRLAVEEVQHALARPPAVGSSTARPASAPPSRSPRRCLAAPPTTGGGGVAAA
jgi:hypothetical protein